MTKDKIIINALCIGEQLSGLGRAALDILNEIEKQGIAVDFVIYINKKSLRHFSKNKFPNIRVVTGLASSDHGIVGHLTRIIFANIIAILNRKKKIWSLSHIDTSLISKNQFIIVHDVIPLILPRENPRLFYFFRYYLDYALRRSRVIFTSSQYSKKRIHEFYPEVNSPVEVVYIGTDLKETNSDVKKENFALYVGRYSPTKNIDNFLNAFVEYRNNGGKLALSICGFEFSDMKDETQNLTTTLLDKSIIKFNGYVSDEELKNMYSKAKVLVLPSFEEGFGLTVLEGLNSRCLIACSNRSSIPEVAGKFAHCFDPCSKTEMEKVLFALEDQSFEYNDNEVLQHLDQFDWKRAIGSYLRSF